MKTCVTCLKTKPLSEFYKRKDSPDGYRNDCKFCRKARSLENFYAAPEVKRQKNMQAYWDRLKNNPNFHAEQYAANREKMLAEAKHYYQKHREKRIQASVAWAKLNRGKANANKKAYKISKIQACPQWVRSDDDLMWMMQEAYGLAAMRTQMFNFSWHVDHAVPLRGKDVSGLHVPWNLQVIPGRENCSKSNHFEG